jgi:hypothetical protein
MYLKKYIIYTNIKTEIETKYKNTKFKYMYGDVRGKKLELWKILVIKRY